MTADALIERLRESLEEAQDHLEYCGYGDEYERECADAQGLPELIEDALKAARKYRGDDD